MWIARDEDNTLHLFDGEINRVTDNCPFGYWQIPNRYFNSSMQLNEKLFPDLKWENEPIEVKIVSKLISEDKLNKIAEEYAKNAENENYKIDWQLEYSDINDAFKAGYRKAKEE